MRKTVWHALAYSPRATIIVGASRCDFVWNGCQLAVAIRVSSIDQVNDLWMVSSDICRLNGGFCERCIGETIECGQHKCSVGLGEILRLMSENLHRTSKGREMPWSCYDIVKSLLCCKYSPISRPV